MNAWLLQDGTGTPKVVNLPEYVTAANVWTFLAQRIGKEVERYQVALQV